MGYDQAAGLRRWSRQRGIESTVMEDSKVLADAPRESCKKTLMVVGMPGTSSRQRRRAQQVLRDWHVAGQRWVGEPEAWQVVLLDVDSPHLSILAGQQPRWALWIDGGEEGFRRAYRTLKCLHAGRGPRRLLALHPGFASRVGLLNNLQQAAEEFFGIELLVLDGTTAR
ncbi:hypothetical protein GCM10007160_04340 [Litchfieldella qijiaojingensis]|uniref:Uncharacterized protein n=1 Tax=Litchfieldella qijiaojingensis TaxID=980347 RepID=A0ABQ2YCM5_9GAMM|nr:hypothetical protein [Halomonas qijiaojingensis]GGX80013.1 hypothetical protein GCM10007160_04340 [Halomonas qijiaojingensis]